MFHFNTCHPLARFADRVCVTRYAFVSLSLCAWACLSTTRDFAMKTLLSTTAPFSTSNAATATPPTTAQSSSHYSDTMSCAATANTVVSGVPVTYQHERQEGCNAVLGGEHFSALIEADGSLEACAPTALQMAAHPLPSRKRDEVVARDFLQTYAPDLPPRMELHWIEGHDERLVVGDDQKPMVFERDIVWTNFLGQRKAEKWLHDTWFKQRNGSIALAAQGGAR